MSDPGELTGGIDLKKSDNKGISPPPLSIRPFKDHDMLSGGGGGVD